MFCTWLFMRITEIKGLLKLVFCILDQTILCMVNSQSHRRLYLHFLKFTNTQLTFYITYVLASLLFNFIQDEKKDNTTTKTSGNKEKACDRFCGHFLNPRNLCAAQDIDILIMW